MRVVVATLVAFVVGFVIGGYAPRSELERVRKELAQARDELSSPVRDRGAWAAGLTQLLQARQAGADTGSPSLEAKPPSAPPPGGAPDLRPAADTASAPSLAEHDGAAVDAGRHAAPDPFDPAHFKEMREAALLRAEQFRRRYVDEAQLDAASEARLDAVIRDLNADVQREVERAVQRIEATGAAPRARDFVDAMVPVLQAYQHADDRLQTSTPPAVREVGHHVGFDLMTQIDPGAFESAMRLLQRFERSDSGRGRAEDR